MDHDHASKSRTSASLARRLKSIPHFYLDCRLQKADHQRQTLWPHSKSTHVHVCTKHQCVIILPTCPANDYRVLTSSMRDAASVMMKKMVEAAPRPASCADGVSQCKLLLSFIIWRGFIVLSTFSLLHLLRGNESIPINHVLTTCTIVSFIFIEFRAEGSRQFPYVFSGG